MLYFSCLPAFISVLALSLTGTVSVGAAHFSCRINPVVCVCVCVFLGGMEGGM